MKKAFLTVLTLAMLMSSLAHAQEVQPLTDGEVRLRLFNAIKRDFTAHIKASGLSRFVVRNKVPMTPLDNKVREFIDKRFDKPISNLEAKLLVRSPKHIPRVKIVRDMAYEITSKLCKDSEAEGNETDSARHFIAAFALSLLAGEKFAYRYLTAHEGWMLDQNLNEYTAYNFASGLMDLNNNTAGLLAARKYQKSLKLFNLEVSVHLHSLKKIKRLAMYELKLARKEKKLISVYAKDGACSQISQRENLRSRVGLPTETAIW